MFDILKFRTMAVGAEDATGPVWTERGDPRITRVGRVLRRFHLDELPQAVNILRGEMSLVGPRPERPALAARIERELPGFSARLRVRPGLAGLAQANGAGWRDPARKLHYDNRYIAAMSPWLDLALCARCLARALGAAPGPAAVTALWRDPERLLLPPIRAGVALVLLVPLVTAPWTLYPFSVGKALWARVLIAAVFALWAVLALARPRWRPPPSALLWLLGAGLAASVLSAAFGVGPQMSFWSTYTRMQGIVNAAHWAAFALVVASVARTPTDWTRLLNANLAVGLAVSVFAIVRFAAPETPLPFPSREGHWPRIGASAGNPILPRRVPAGDRAARGGVPGALVLRRGPARTGWRARLGPVREGGGPNREGPVPQGGAPAGEGARAGAGGRRPGPQAVLGRDGGLRAGRPHAHRLARGPRGADGGGSARPARSTPRSGARAGRGAWGWRVSARSRQARSRSPWCSCCAPARRPSRRPVRGRARTRRSAAPASAPRFAAAT